MEHFWVGLVGGVLASVHCLGMCGGFVLYLSRQHDRRTMVAAQILWHVGRTFTYIFLGALAGYAGSMAEPFMQHGMLQMVFSVVTGGVIVLMGLTVLGLVPLGRRLSTGESWLATFFGSRIAAPTPGVGLTLGLATGCLPCPLVIGFLAYSLKAGSVETGMLTMAGAGIGTMASLLVLGAGGRFMGLHARRWGRTAGGIILIVLGLGTMLRGSTSFHALLGCGTAPAVKQQGAAPPCCSKGTHGHPAGQ